MPQVSMWTINTEINDEMNEDSFEGKECMIGRLWQIKDEIKVDSLWRLHYPIITCYSCLTPYKYCFPIASSSDKNAVPIHTII